MITDADITKIKKAFKKDFATKDDLKAFATKSELKKSHDKLQKSHDKLQEAIADVHVELGELRDDVNDLKGKFETFDVKLDKIIGGIEDQRLENAAGAVHRARHDRQIEVLALAANVTLPN